MFRRAIVASLIAAGLFSVAIGVQRWYDAHAAETVVHALMHAVDRGDRQAAVELLRPHQRNLLEIERANAETSASWQPQQGVTWQVDRIEIAGNSAIASLAVRKDGFVVRPAIHLRRGKTARWQIDRVEHLEIDPRYLKLRRRHLRRQGERLAAEVEQALQDRRKMKVERVALPQSPASRLR